MCGYYTIDIMNAYFLRIFRRLLLTFILIVLVFFFALSFGVWPGIIDSYCI